jgi:methionyl-tRNA formyltransferase
MESGIRFMKDSKSTPGVVIFAYHKVGAMALRTMLCQGINIHLVVTHKDDPAENVWFDSVSAICNIGSIRYIYAEDYTNDEICELVDQFDVSVICSFYFRSLLPAHLLGKARYGAVNMHGSLLPKYRGRAPVNWQIINGENSSGMTLHYMVDRPDAGDIIDQEVVEIGNEETPSSLFDKLEFAGKKILERSLLAVLDGTCSSVPQDHAEATYFGGRAAEDGRIDWRWHCEKIYNLIRGVTKPYPGAFTYLNQKRVIIWWATVAQLSEWCGDSRVGSIAVNERGVFVRTGRGHIKLVEIQIQNKAYRCAEMGALFKPGDIFHELNEK